MNEKVLSWCAKYCTFRSQNALRIALHGKVNMMEFEYHKYNSISEFILTFTHKLTITLVTDGGRTRIRRHREHARKLLKYICTNAYNVIRLSVNIYDGYYENEVIETLNEIRNCHFQIETVEIAPKTVHTKGITLHACAQLVEERAQSVSVNAEFIFGSKELQSQFIQWMVEAGKPFKTLQLAHCDLYIEHWVDPWIHGRSITNLVLNGCSVDRAGQVIKQVVEVELIRLYLTDMYDSAGLRELIHHFPPLPKLQSFSVLPCSMAGNDQDWYVILYVLSSVQST